jgi:hypothetical protein
MRETTTILSKSGVHVATIGFNEGLEAWQILIVRRNDLEFFCPSKEIPFMSWHEEFDPETGFPRSSRPVPLY